MNATQILAALLPIFLQAEPQLVADIANLVHGNPQAQGEADDAYAARLLAQIDQNTKKIAAEDAAIQQ